MGGILGFDLPGSFILAKANILALREPLDISCDFSWTVNASVSYWYRVESKCGPRNCPPFPFQDDLETCSQGTYLTVYMTATSLPDLCQKLIDRNLQFPIKRVTKYSLPVNESNSGCNVLTDVTDQITQIGEPCLSFFVEFDGVIATGTMEMNMEPVNYHHIMSGGLTLGGEHDNSSTINDSTVYFYTMSGGLVIGGTHGVEMIGDGLTFGTSGGVGLGGSMGVKPIYKYKSTLPLSLGGSVPLAVIPMADINISASIDMLETITARYAAISADPMVSHASDSIITTCCATTQTPLVFQLTHDLDRANVLTQFLQRNEYVLPNPMQLTFNKITNMWQGNQYFTGRVSSEPLVWNITIEFGCSSSTLTPTGPDDTTLWKLLFSVMNKNKDTSQTFYTRILLFFSASVICRNAAIEFSGEFNTITKTANPATSTSPVFFDEIGLFNSMSWKHTPNFEFGIFKTIPPGSTVTTYPEISLPITTLRAAEVIS